MEANHEGEIDEAILDSITGPDGQAGGSTDEKAVLVQWRGLKLRWVPSDSASSSRCSDPSCSRTSQGAADDHIGDEPFGAGPIVALANGAHSHDTYPVSTTTPDWSQATPLPLAIANAISRIEDADRRPQLWENLIFTGQPAKIKTIQLEAISALSEYVATEQTEAAQVLAEPTRCKLAMCVRCECPTTSPSSRTATTWRLSWVARSTPSSYSVTRRQRRSLRSRDTTRLVLIRASRSSSLLEMLSTDAMLHCTSRSCQWSSRVEHWFFELVLRWYCDLTFSKNARVTTRQGLSGLGIPGSTAKNPAEPEDQHFARTFEVGWTTEPAWERPSSSCTITFIQRQPRRFTLKQSIQLEMISRTV